MLILLLWLCGSSLLGFSWALVGWQLGHPRSAPRLAASGRLHPIERFALTIADDLLDRVETSQLTG